MTVIATDRLILRPLRASDAGDIARQLNNLEIAQWTGRVPHPYALSDAEEFLDLALSERQGFCRRAITRRGEDRLIGVCALETNETEPPEIGYWLAQPEWGKGYVSEATEALVAHGFANMGFNLLMARHWHGNDRSRRILEKLGFQHIRDEVHVSKAQNREVLAAYLELPHARWQARAASARKST